MQEQEKYAEAIETLKNDVRAKINDAKSSKSLITLIATIERLGLGYHFEIEITSKLEKIYEDLHDKHEDHDLFTTALGFLLLRQHQYQVSCCIFEKFKDGENKFKDDVANDAEGLLSLYEAAHARIHGEDILDEAVPFTTHHLKRILATEKRASSLEEQITRALEHPYYRGPPIIEIRVFISLYEKNDSKDPLLLKLAKLNFNFLQNMYKKEMSELTKWWIQFDIKSKLTHTRDRLIECYLWGTSFHYEPQYAFIRTIIAKNIQLASIMDDTYDNYATIEEAQLFTDILERWDINEIGLLPNYMKIAYEFIMGMYEDFKREAEERDKSFAVPAYVEAVKQLARAYNQELIWIMERQMPSFEDYMKNTLITGCMYVMFSAVIPGLKSATKDIVDWLGSEPKLYISTAKMGRHLDNLGSEDRENREGKLLTAVDYYIKEHGVSRKEALSKFKEFVENEWKSMNTEWVAESSVPKEMAVQFINYGRISEVTYKNSIDHFTFPEKFFTPIITAIFVDPIAI
ncbi:Alpha-humulene/(-)-(E)-beta-caryophyllene synthase [Striga hermonthica]|uniref:Alpha-humulene/(-)-(E)-beta-caryophyllene synthase n=1 Tax=Striga hermonthica TaxID=68872 RepID=A0A9N7MTQ8_STRHE|nr:Alpha-humulene/(-)-(E)-beta-caryophyllene synthase [Striga hermonthica]